MEGNIVIKKCNIQDVLILRHQVMYPEKDLKYVEVPGDYDESTIHLGLYDNRKEDGDKKPISVMSLFIKKECGDMQFRKFATMVEHQNKGYGTILFNYVLNFAKDNNIKRIWCNARKEKIDFYLRKFNFKETNQTYTKDGREFIIIELIL
ncbi:hypothetical protein DICPUDRAFT_39689 [Dictyostelium purpureum]|uniref:N-acetyltransferase domain-containing protein n=1 Tax=Dictyostelium purpureum TaxID=5786 RepID=F0ZWS1_DICPU|nr:uncharacterized protein DICPUDRAFT_39689 [Dictyostelium purpureum]EGC31603.1 hypothetical protein DICPUDRAFT_39689 [Dictyostelium purpureum]|eukprot:XP_003291861.1 hypothetical protein DICPUDRAFT_39689 [Dictyostelium purpureum]